MSTLKELWLLKRKEERRGEGEKEEESREGKKEGKRESWDGIEGGKERKGGRKEGMQSNLLASKSTEQLVNRMLEIPSNLTSVLPS